MQSQAKYKKFKLVHIIFFFKYEPSSSSLPYKILCSSLTHFLIEQAQTCSQFTWLTYCFPIYCETMIKNVSPFHNSMTFYYK